MVFKDVYAVFSAEPWARLLRTPEKIAEELSVFDNPQTAVEVGTAEAYNLRRLVAQSTLTSAIGYDISPRRLEKAKQRVETEGLTGKISLCRGDGRQLPFADDAVDVTLLPQVLEHLPTRRRIIDLLVESRRVSRQGLLVSLPLRDASHPLIGFRYERSEENDEFYVLR